MQACFQRTHPSPAWRERRDFHDFEATLERLANWARLLTTLFSMVCQVYKTYCKYFFFTGTLGTVRKYSYLVTSHHWCFSVLSVQFNRCVTSQMIKWFSNFREFFYIQMERFARQAVREALTRSVFFPIFSTVYCSNVMLLTWIEMHILGVMQGWCTSLGQRESAASGPGYRTLPHTQHALQQK